LRVPIKRRACGPSWRSANPSGRAGSGAHWVAQVELQEIPRCPICGGGDTRHAARRTHELGLGSGRAVRWCTSCGHGFLFPAPTEAELAEFYAAAPGYSGEAFERRYGDRLHKQHEHLVATICDLEPGAESILDFGAGDGAFLSVAAQRGLTPIGYEPTPSLAEAARFRGLTVHSGPLEAVPIPRRSIDVARSAHVLEHLADPVGALCWMHERLIPGGLLALEVPNQFQDILWPFLHERWLEKSRPLGYHLHHLHFFTMRSLSRAVRSAGFEVLDVSTRFELRNRRTAAEGPNPWVRAAKTAIYSLAGRIGKGPHIELYARKAAQKA